MRENWITCHSRDHEGEEVHLNLDRVDLIYADKKGGSVVIMSGDGWKDPLHVVEPPEQLVYQQPPK